MTFCPTADDNLETVLMHFIRGTGLKGLGGITPVSGSLLRPMLDVTRQEVLSFLKEYNLSYVTDSTNEQDLYLRNRLRHKVIPLLKEENPRLAVMTTDLAQRLRQDEAVLQELVKDADPASVCSLRNLPAALRSRAITEFLQKNGVEEPESAHIRGIDRIVHSDKPSARISLRNGVTVSRCYDRLTVIQINELPTRELLCPGEVTIPECNATVRCQKATEPVKNKDCFTVTPVGKMYIRHRIPGDSMRLSGGTKELKKLFIDRKIPAHKRLQMPVLADDLGVIGVYGIGANLDRIGMSNSAVTIYFENHEKKEEDEK